MTAPPVAAQSLPRTDRRATAPASARPLREPGSPSGARRAMEHGVDRHPVALQLDADVRVRRGRRSAARDRLTAPPMRPRGVVFTIGRAPAPAQEPARIVRRFPVACAPTRLPIEVVDSTSGRRGRGPAAMPARQPPNPSTAGRRRWRPPRGSSPPTRHCDRAPALATSARRRRAPPRVLALRRGPPPKSAATTAAPRGDKRRLGATVTSTGAVTIATLPSVSHGDALPAAPRAPPATAYTPAPSGGSPTAAARQT
jgi:hypothetical protein